MTLLVTLLIGLTAGALFLYYRSSRTVTVAAELESTDPVVLFERNMARYLEAKREGDAIALSPTHQEIAAGLVDLVDHYTNSHGVGEQPREVISAMASIVGELAILAANEFSVTEHSFVVGQRVFSDRINALLFSDRLDQIGAASVVGILRDHATGGRLQRHHMMSIHSLVRGFAGRLGDPKDWGGAPLSLPSEYQPVLLPLRVALDNREEVAKVLQPAGPNRILRLRIAALALARVIVREVGRPHAIDPEPAFTLALETVHAIAKTAPMKQPMERPSDDWLKVQREVIRMAGSVDEYRRALRGEPDIPVPERR